jgi:hypothetical protein
LFHNDTASGLLDEHEGTQSDEPFPPASPGNRLSDMNRYHHCSDERMKHDLRVGSPEFEKNFPRLLAVLAMKDKQQRDRLLNALLDEIRHKQTQNA